MRRGRVVVLVAAMSGLLSALLAVAVNVATGGVLPGPLAGVSWLAWPAVGLLVAVSVWLAVWQQRTAGDDALPAEPADAAAAPAELPAEPAGFAGRTADLATVDRLLAEQHRVLALVGPPGIGKSSLALHVAHARRDQFPDGQLFAALRGASANPVAPETALTRFLGALGVPEDERRGGVEELAARFRSAVADRRLLVLLDDARDADQVRPLVPGGPGCLVLVTSRRMVADLPGSVVHPLGGLDEEEGLVLLAGAAGAERVAADPAGAARIVHLCGGLPLALRIAGSRLRVRPAWTLGDLADRLADERSRLDELRLGDAAVRSTFETSYRELSTVDRLVFRRAGAHPGRVFGAGAAAALAGLAEPDVAATMERLVDTHLVESPAPGRYRLHDLLRLFATERLAADETPGDREACLTRLLDWLTRNARAGQWLAEERDNVVAAVRQAVAAGEYEPAWALVDAMHPLLTTAGDHPERLALWLCAADAAAALGDEHRQARALRWVSNSYRASGEVGRALEPAEQAVALAERLGDHRMLAEGLFAYGEAMRYLYRYDEAEKALTRALELFLQLGDVAEQLDVANALGTLYNAFWQPERALAVLPWSNAPATGEDYRLAWALIGLGTGYRLTGTHATAVKYNARAVETCRRIGDDLALGYALQERGWLANDEGRHDDAVRDMREMLTVFERIRHTTGIGAAYEALGILAAGPGRYDEAIKSFDAAIVQFEKVHDRVRCGKSRLYRADSLAQAGRVTEARTEWAAADELLGDVPLPEVALTRERLRERVG